MGGRPVGGRPVGGRFAGGEFGAFDPDEWSADVAAVVCERSAVIQLGATLVATDDQVWIPESVATGGVRPAPDPVVRSSNQRSSNQLRPQDHILEAMVAVPDALAGRVAEQPTLGAPVEADLGEALSRAADGAFLAGLPHAVSKDGARAPRAGGDLLKTLRNVVTKVLGQRPAFRSPGWVLHPDLLDRVLRIRTIDGEQQSTANAARSTANAARSLSSFGLLRVVSAGEGMLLGFPFVTSFKATNGADPGEPRIYFASDWQEAYVAIDPSFVTVDLPVTPFVEDATVIRASMPVDFALRRTTAFAWADPPPP